MTIGLPIFRNPRELRVDRLLTQPFRDDTVAAMTRAVRARIDTRLGECLAAAMLQGARSP